MSEALLVANRTCSTRAESPVSAGRSAVSVATHLAGGMVVRRRFAQISGGNRHLVVQSNGGLHPVPHFVRPELAHHACAPGARLSTLCHRHPAQG